MTSFYHGAALSGRLPFYGAAYRCSGSAVLDIITMVLPAEVRRI